MSELAAPYETYVQSGEVNFKVEDKEGKIRELQKAYSSGQIDHLDGITVDMGSWWFNVRMSNTEPLLRLNLEADDEDLMKEKLEELKGHLGEVAEGH